MESVKASSGTLPLGSNETPRPETGSPGRTSFSALLALARSPSTTALAAASRSASAAPSRNFASVPQRPPELSIHERALGLRAYRQELIASNIANADTPHYKAVDIDVNAALRAGYSGANLPPPQFRVPAQASADNNTVDLDTERVQFAGNALMYEFAVDRVRGHYRDMDDLLKGTPY